MRKDRYRIGRVGISITDEDRAIETIKEAIREKRKGYVCISNLKTVRFANKDDAYWQVMENSLMNTPDGTPLVWCAHWWGLKDVQRACGPHIFTRMLKDKDPELRHFLLGDTVETLAALSKKAEEEYGAVIAGSCSPPFKPLGEYDLEGMAKMINESGATVVWTALTAPKQDILGSMITPFLNDGIVMVGVGAAFRSVLGVLKQPDGVLQKIGLAGILFKRPEMSWWSLVKWYAWNIPYLVMLFFTIKWRKLTGKKYYELNSKARTVEI